jgi:hypothetical protein
MLWSMKKGRLSKSGSACRLWTKRSQVRAVASTHCTMCGKGLPLITSPRPRTVREPTTLGTSLCCDLWGQTNYIHSIFWILIRRTTRGRVWPLSNSWSLHHIDQTTLYRKEYIFCFVFALILYFTIHIVNHQFLMNNFIYNLKRTVFFII